MNSFKNLSFESFYGDLIGDSMMKTLIKKGSIG